MSERSNRTSQGFLSWLKSLNEETKNQNTDTKVAKSADNLKTKRPHSSPNVSAARIRAISSDDLTEKTKFFRKGHSSATLNPLNNSEPRGSLATTELNTVYIPKSSPIPTLIKSAPQSPNASPKQEGSSPESKFSLAQFCVNEVAIDHLVPNPKEFHAIFSPLNFFFHKKIQIVFNKNQTNVPFFETNENPFEWLIEYLQKETHLQSPRSAHEQILILQNPLKEEEPFLRGLIEEYRKEWRKLSEVKPYMSARNITQQKFEAEVEEAFLKWTQENISSLKKKTFEDAFTQCYDYLGFHKIKCHVPTFEYLKSLSSLDALLHNGLKNLTVRLGSSFNVRLSSHQTLIYNIVTMNDGFSITHQRTYIIEKIVEKKKEEKIPPVLELDLPPAKAYDRLEQNCEVKTKSLCEFKVSIECKKGETTLTFEPPTTYSLDLEENDKTKNFIKKAFVALTPPPLKRSQVRKQAHSGTYSSTSTSTP